ncbi:pantoate--beta-alanine ligase [Oleiharenicola lentus]|jgi:pantoate--beta-alanine ligase|uniref:Pantothenate synthetase n=1 Tax=Oleiharenicola lentus TaxID=2508720 RepID=A0A4Q1C5G1_9BACT|nr:pantoate--beta-alanine ligase [Oleiharenicola lentus]RXK53565.1 pantoate--beta-alanine ligase [Oleiharenicola lentus]
MNKVTSISAMKAAAAALRASGRRVALLPTLGALHAGHASLIRIARESGAAVVVSAFVNPLQFGASEDYAKYPRTPEADAMLAEKEGVELLFTPTADEMFPKGFSSLLQEDAISKPLCGVTRPALFRGALTCWLKLMNIVQPDAIVLGERDAQLLAVFKKTAADLLLPVEILTGPTVRDADGMVVSARNAYLTPSQREEALAVVRALRKAKEMVDSGVKSTDRIVAEATHIITAKRRLRVIYIAVVDQRTMEPMREINSGQCLMAVSYWVDEVRLTDNMPL